jgi:phytoene dehydrogenase-like protein
MAQVQSKYDVVIIGGGHNGLVSAAYLAKAGLSVLVLERQPQIGGAVQTVKVFKGIDAKLSRYAYLLSLFPRKISSDLGLHFESRRRSVASFTPTVRNGQHMALLISNVDEGATVESFRKLTGNNSEYMAFQRFNHLMEVFAQKVWPTLLTPLQSRADMQSQFTDPDAQEAWKMLVEEPLGIGLERILHDDRVRGLAFTNAKIGVLTHPHDPTLLQNRTYLYHIIGQGTGEWQIVLGGMGSITAALEQSALAAGTHIQTSAAVNHIQLGAENTVEYTQDGQTHTVQAKYVLSNVAPSVLNKLLVNNSVPSYIDEGSAFKINMVLKRLPRLKAQGYAPEQAFNGTFHMDEGYEALTASYQQAMQGLIPDQPPGEMYCQTMTDPSTLSPELRAAGYHTITLFGIDMRAKLFESDNAGTREKILRSYVKSINNYLEDPLEECLAIDADGKPCIEAKSALDLEAELAMPQGNIFHQNLTWPFTDESAQVGTWGVETPYSNLFICGSGAVRGGCVSGVPGHNAAMKVLECEGLS